MQLSSIQLLLHDQKDEFIKISLPDFSDQETLLYEAQIDTI